MTDNPFLVLDAPWVTEPQRAAANALGRWLQEHLTADVVARCRYRPGDPRERPVAPVTANGADPAQPRRIPSLPEPRVLARIKAAWQRGRKPRT